MFRCAFWSADGGIREASVAAGALFLSHILVGNLWRVVEDPALLLLILLLLVLFPHLLHVLLETQPHQLARPVLRDTTSTLINSTPSFTDLPTLTYPLPASCTSLVARLHPGPSLLLVQLPATGLGSLEDKDCPYLCFGLGSIWSRQVFQLELGHLGFVEVVSQLQPVLGQTDASRPGECGSLFLTTEHLNVLLVWDKLTRNGLGGEKQICC